MNTDKKLTNPNTNPNTNHFNNLKDSFDLRRMKNLKKTKFASEPKNGSIHSRNANMILKGPLDMSGISNPMIDTPRFEPNQDQFVKKIIDLEKQLYEKERETFNRISEMQKQINWLTSTVYTLIESNEKASKIQKEESSKIAEEFRSMTSPPGLPIPQSKLFEKNLQMLQSPEPSPTSKNSEFILIDAEIDMINGNNKNIYPAKRNVITPINECFTPDSCGSPYVNANVVLTPTGSR